MIQFKCSKCGEDLEAPASETGKVLECPKCGLHEEVPKSSNKIVKLLGFPSLPKREINPPKPLQPPLPAVFPIFLTILFFIIGVFAILSSFSVPYSHYSDTIYEQQLSAMSTSASAAKGTLGVASIIAGGLFWLGYNVDYTLKKILYRLEQ